MPGWISYIVSLQLAEKIVPHASIAACIVLIYLAHSCHRLRRGRPFQEKKKKKKEKNVREAYEPDPKQSTSLR